MNTEVANLSLRHLGITKTIGNLDTENSAEANAVRAFYDLALKNVTRDYSWPFATRIISLNLVEENPNEEWLYSYRYPVDCARIRRILSGIRNETLDQRVSYKIIGDSSGRLIFTDKEDAELEYVSNVVDDNFMTSDFILAFSFKLAYYLAPGLTGGDPFKLGERADKSYEIEISQARSNAYNEEQPDTNDASVYTVARE